MDIGLGQYAVYRRRLCLKFSLCVTPSSLFLSTHHMQSEEHFTHRDDPLNGVVDDFRFVLGILQSDGSFAFGPQFAVEVVLPRHLVGRVYFVR